MSTQIDHLYDTVVQNDLIKNPKKLIQIIESDKSIVDIVHNDKQNHKLTELLAYYGIALMEIGYLKKSISCLNRAIKWSESEYKHKDIWKSPLYESLLFNRAFVNSKLKKKKKSKKDFKKLAHKFPNNELYQNWFNSLGTSIYNILEWTFAGIGLIGLASSFFINKDNETLSKLSLVGIILGISGGLIINLIIKKKIKK